MTDWRGIPEEYRNAIVTGDARELAKRLPDESVDLIFTDPVYDRIDDYHWLSWLAKRTLKPDTACLVFYGIGYAPRIFAALSKCLSYKWQMVHFMPGQNQRGEYMVFSNWKAMVYFQKGDARPNRHIRDLILDRSVRVLPDAGAGHAWMKNADTVAYYLSAFSDPDSVVFDPFTGGGTVPAVCKMLGRNYVAFEIDPDTADIARKRVRETQPPLFVPQPEQVAMDI